MATKKDMTNTKNTDLIEEFELSEEEQLALDEHGESTKSVDIPRCRMNKGKIEFVKGDSVSRHPEGADMILMSMLPTGRDMLREYNPHAYNPDNPKPATCFSIDGKFPHEEAIKPMVLDKVTGNRTEVKSCSSCPGKFGDKKCTYKKAMVCCLPDETTVDGLFTMVVPAASCFHGGADLLDNPAPEKMTGLMPFLKRVGSLKMGASGKPVSTMRLITNVQVLDQEKQGTAMTFSYHKGGNGDNIALADIDQVRALLAMQKSSEFKTLQDAYVEHLIAGVKSIKKADEGSDEAEPESAAAVSMDDLQDVVK